MHDVAYSVAFYLGLTGAFLLWAIAVCRTLGDRVPAFLSRWAQPRGVLESVVGVLTLTAVVTLLLWLVGIVH